MSGAFRRIYFDLETEDADRLREVVKESGLSQREVIRRAIIEAVTAWEKQNGKSKKQK